MTGLEEFEALFGNVTVASLVELGLVAVFLVKIWRKVKEYLDRRNEDWLAEEKAKETRKRADEERDQKLDKALAAIDKYPEYRAQSLRVQRELEDKIGALTKSQDANTEKLHQPQRRAGRLQRPAGRTGKTREGAGEDPGGGKDCKQTFHHTVSR